LNPFNQLGRSARRLNDSATAPTARIEASFGETRQDEFGLCGKFESDNFDERRSR
jgi:hypothetical protein